MQILMHQNGPFMVNTYLLVNDENKKAIIIDPGSGIDPVLDKIRQDGTELAAVLCTHAHIDHVGGVPRIKEQFDAPVYINDGEKEIVDSLTEQARMFGLQFNEKIQADENLPEKGEIEIAGISMKLLYTPGHSPGSVSLYLADPGVVFSGDALFNMSIGRTDLPGGNYQQLITSIKEQLLVLPDETSVLSGHGPETSIGSEKKTNPFLN